MSLSTLWEIMEDRGVWPAAVHGVEKSRTWLNNGATTTKLFSLPKSSIFALLEKHIYFVYLFFYFTILYWFCHTSTWIHHRCTHVPKKKKKNGMTPPKKNKRKEKHIYQACPASPCPPSPQRWSDRASWTGLYLPSQAWSRANEAPLWYNSTTGHAGIHLPRSEHPISGVRSGYLWFSS